MNSSFQFTCLVSILAVVSSAQEEITTLLRETIEQSREKDGRWSLHFERLTMVAANRFDNHDPRLVTAALYSQLKSDAPLGTNRAIVAIVVKGTTAFSPDTWLDLMDHENDVFYHTSAMGIFSVTKFYNHPRFQAVLRDALQDKRIGLPPLSPSHTQNHRRVCDVAYNILMKHRENKPLDYPIQIQMHRARADAMIADLRRELGIPDPALAPISEPNPAAPALKPMTQVGAEGPNAPSVAAVPVSREVWSVYRWMILAGLLIVVAGGIALSLRKPDR